MDGFYLVPRVMVYVIKCKFMLWQTTHLWIPWATEYVIHRAILIGSRKNCEVIIIIIINYIYIALNTNKFLSALQKKYMLTYIYFNLTTIYFTTIDKWEYGHK